MKNELASQDMEEWFDDNGIEAMEAMSDFLKVQLQTSVELTKLVLEHCKFEKINQDQVFNIFQDASQAVAKNIKALDS